MDLSQLTREWDYSSHLAYLQDDHLAWQPMVDDHGKALEGIDGKHGVRGIKADGTAIGADFVRMRPGAAFPKHTHEGDHEIYFISGEGYVHIDDQAIFVRGGTLIHIPAELPHAVACASYAKESLIFMAVGHPHKHVDSLDRMRTVE